MATDESRYGEARLPAAMGCLIETSMGWVGAAARAGGILRVTLPRRRRADALHEWSASGSFQRPAGILLDLANDLRRYFRGTRVDFARYRVDLRGHPPFRRRVLLAARAIPYGQVRSYGWLAGLVGEPGASRAVGQAMAHNPLPLVIPCHRVVRANATVGEFGGGRAMKRELLELEGVRLKGDEVVCDRALLRPLHTRGRLALSRGEHLDPGHDP